MGAPKGNDNAKSKSRTRVSVHLSIGDTKSSKMISLVCNHLESLGIEPTDKNIAEFVKEESYKHLREVLGE
jgi:hypothetical protein